MPNDNRDPNDGFKGCRCIRGIVGNEIAIGAVAVAMPAKIERPYPVSILETTNCFLPGITAATETVKAQHVRGPAVTVYGGCQS